MWLSPSQRWERVGDRRGPPPCPGDATASDASGATTEWLCRPGQAHDPCTAPLATTVVPASGARTIQSGQDDAGSKFDCFYVYPTVSTQHSDNANLTVQPAEVAAAVTQASRFSQVCQVWAPMYRQRTESSLLKGLGADPHADAVAYESVLSAWEDYLAHDNHGRPVVFLGHSQGAAMLIRLLASQVDPNAHPAQAHRGGDPGRRQRDRARRKDGRRDLCASASLHQSGPERVRHCVFVVPL